MPAIPSTNPTGIKALSCSRSYDQVPSAITPVEYGGLQKAYDHFNAELFAGALPDCFKTYQRKANSAGYFAPDRFSSRVGDFDRHELALNPDGFVGLTDEQICQTLVHEMAHAWQEHFGASAARGYHNKEWAAKMKECGLQPSSTGMIGGEETGQHMSDYIIPSGQFARAFAELAATGWKLNLQSAHHERRAVLPNSKQKFACPGCGQNAWGKPDLAIDCRLRGLSMLAPGRSVISYDPIPASRGFQPLGEAARESRALRIITAQRSLLTREENAMALGFGPRGISYIRYNAMGVNGGTWSDRNHDDIVFVALCGLEHIKTGWLLFESNMPPDLHWDTSLGQAGPRPGKGHKRGLCLRLFFSRGRHRLAQVDHQQRRAVHRHR